MSLILLNSHLRLSQAIAAACSRVFALSQDVCVCINALIFFDRRFRLDWPDRRQVGMCLAGALSLPDTQKAPRRVASKEGSFLPFP